MNLKEIHQVLEEIYESDLKVPFIEEDPVQIPHQFSKKQDVEITAFWTAMLAWGQRVTIINKARELFALMDNAPHDFILNHKEKDLERFANFKHRTFNYTDTLYFIRFFKRHYERHTSLESAFLLADQFQAKKSLIAFHHYFFDDEYSPQRTRKHIATPERQSACKRINLFLKWMVRKDSRSGDLGIFSNIEAKDLMLPLDVHVMRSLNQLGITSQQKPNWTLVEEVSNFLRQLDEKDPIKYDYSLFMLSKNR